MWFAFKLVSLNHWKQCDYYISIGEGVVICFQISIFEPLETIIKFNVPNKIMLWFAFKLVSLNHWKQFLFPYTNEIVVVICFQISIFEPLETILAKLIGSAILLWFAFKLVSLNHWKQYEAGVIHQLDCCDLLSN